jgi:hypothetical protein
VSTVMPHTIDKKGRCAVDAAAYATDKIAAYFVPVLARLEGIPQGCFGKPERCANQQNRRKAQPALVFKEGIVHIPKQARCAGELGAFGGDLGVGCTSVRGK